MSYTPTTEEVRMYYKNPEGSRIAWQVSPVEFDRWLAEVKAEAWEEGKQVAEDHYVPGIDCDCFPANPYRQVD